MTAKLAATIVASHDGDEEDDVGALIYREIQLRKTEAAAKPHLQRPIRRTSNQKRSSFNNHGKEFFSRQQSKSPSKMNRVSSIAEDSSRKKVAKNPYRKKCSAAGCTNAQRVGVCIRQGQKVSNANYAAVKDAQIDCHRRSLSSKAWGNGQTMQQRRMRKSKDSWKGMIWRHGAKRPNDAAEKDAQVTL